MSERAKNATVIAIAVAALGVIIFGLASGPPSQATDAERVVALSSAIKCPFCSGESLADSGSGVAADYRVLIEQRVAEGDTDEQILQEFADNFGDSYILDTSTSSWSLMLWVVPLVGLVAGIAAVVALRRSSKQRASVDA